MADKYNNFHILFKFIVPRIFFKERKWLACEYEYFIYRSYTYSAIVLTLTCSTHIRVICIPYTKTSMKKMAERLNP